MEYRNILLIKMSSLGDVLHTLPFAAALRKRFPKARITWLVHPQFSGFLPDPPVIDEVIYFDKAGFKKLGLRDKLRCFLGMKRELEGRKFDLVIDMQGLFKSAVLAAISGCKERIGYAEMREGSGLISRAIKGEHAKGHVVERYLDVARYLGAKVEGIDDVVFPMPDLSKEEAKVKEKLSLAGIGSAPYTVMVPGARWETKEWPVGHYIALAKKISSGGMHVVLAGGADDAAKGRVIAEGAAGDGPGKVIDMTGRTTLKELAALIKGCAVYISADTGPLHLAAAMKKPLIAMYGPTKADRTGPYGSRASTVLLTPAPCGGCLKKKCSSWHCMHDITPETVYGIYKEKAGLS